MKKVIFKLTGTYLNTLSIINRSYAGKVGYQIFCRPMRVKMKAKQLDFLNTANKFNLDFNGDNIQAYKWGNGPKKILFLHGWQSHTYRWKQYIEALSKDDYTIYAFDAPGHGLSEGNLLNVVLYSSVVRQFIKEAGAMDYVVGHSVGGFTALYTISHYPEVLIGKAVIMGSPGDASDFVTFYSSALSLTNRAVTAMTDYFQNALGYPIGYYTLDRFSKNLSLPGLVIHDAEDKDAPVHYADLLNKQWPQATYIRTEGLGHNLKSKEVVDAVVNFINEEIVVEMPE